MKLNLSNWNEHSTIQKTPRCPDSYKQIDMLFFVYAMFVWIYHGQVMLFDKNKVVRYKINWR